MRLTPICILLVGLMGCYASEQPVKPTATDKPNTLQDAAIEAIRKLGGVVEIDTKSPGRPVTDVMLHGPKVTDSGLVHLKGLTSLQSLTPFDTQVTDAGVKELQAALPNCSIYW